LTTRPHRTLARSIFWPFCVGLKMTPTSSASLTTCALVSSSAEAGVDPLTGLSAISEREPDASSVTIRTTDGASFL
jgi:hypothetical protein